VSVSGRHHIRAARVYLGVDGYRGRIDRTVALHHVALVVDQEKVPDRDVAEVHPQGFTQKWSDSSGSRAVM
jgi:hypothetical protein